MRAIIIDDKDAAALVDALKLEALEKRFPISARLLDPALPREQVVDVMRDEIHRSFHYIVVRWLQEQGATARHL